VNANALRRADEGEAAYARVRYQREGE